MWLHQTNVITIWQPFLSIVHPTITKGIPCSRESVLLPLKCFKLQIHKQVFPTMNEIVSPQHQSIFTSDTL